jgi:type II secretory pathway pseudopilin PulG
MNDCRQYKMNSYRLIGGRHRRTGLTLVELLVVIVILTMVTAATIPLMAPVTGQRKVREAARTLATMLAQAQAQALSSGRPAGVWLQRLESTLPGQPPTIRSNQAIDLFLCESPPPYTGETPQAQAAVAMQGNNLATVMFMDMDTSGQLAETALPPRFVFPGDHIRLNYRGSDYQIVSGASYPDGSLNGRNVVLRVLVTDVRPPVVPTPYQIYRQPVKAAGDPVTLPVGSLVDLSFSGVNGAEFAVLVGEPGPTNPTSLADAAPDRPVCIMFGPTGTLDSVYFGRRPKSASASRSDYEPYKPISSVYLLVGQPPNDTGTSRLNVVNTDNLWVAVNPQSGLVTTSEVKGPPTNVTLASNWTQVNDVAPLIINSREYARLQQNMGGR